jgi:hypothetical protein
VKIPYYVLIGISAAVIAGVWAYLVKVKKNKMK